MPAGPAGDELRVSGERPAGGGEPPAAPGPASGRPRPAPGEEPAAVGPGTGEDVEGAAPPAPDAGLHGPLRSRLIAARLRMQTTPAGRATFRVLVALVGAVVVVIGLVLVPLPGPGWFIVFAGLAIWAIEFVWARHLLRVALRLLTGWRAWLSRRHWLVRLPVVAAILLVVLVAVWLSVRLVLGYDPVENVFE